ncbi:MAG: heavy metal-binding domain-containing protein [Candidatus Bathyarchaeota archaeon]|nr:heavy metal-binding domain-containing protein [Candidatus Bathyarchaeota archaeon]
MPYCTKCGAEMPENMKFCTRCGAPVGYSPAVSEFPIVTTPTIPGYRVTKVVGVITGVTARTRGIGGKFVASIQSMVGGEVSAFTTEIEKARAEAIQRMKRQAQRRGANAVIGLDMESSDLLSVIVISATGTAVVAEPEQPT